ncbi:hypothetical protein ACFFMN_23385 [Planobispora siamensis]|uniref:Uncharacterized protein n=1 Tax=Planobispora siamensis TaxID=936338 RepID=A0A8J3SLZ8_9ACTN|nr:hypothetical protein [Planobispora siamensis]GIH95307.1 hypothetical protein Psi01_59370 [Planobispora siamensis]
MARFATTDHVRAHLALGGDYGDFTAVRASARQEMILTGDGTLILTHATLHNGNQGWTVRHAGTGIDLTTGEPFTTTDAAQQYAALIMQLPGFDTSGDLTAQMRAYPGGWWNAAAAARRTVGVTGDAR